MKLIVLLVVVSCSYAAKLDRTYLPPPGAVTSGGDAESLFVPLEPKSPEGTIGKPQDRTPNQYFSTNGNQRPMQRPVPGERIGDSQGENTREITIPASKAGLDDSNSSPSSPFNDNQRAIQRPMPGDRSGNFPNIYQEDNSAISPVSRAGLRPNVEKQSDETLDFSQDPSSTHSQNSDNLSELKGTVFGKPEDSVTKTLSSNNPTYTERENKLERAQAANDRAAETIRYDTEIDGDSYHYSYETSNGISAEEKGVATNGVQAEGSYSYTGDDGKFYSVTYTADENGFQPHGDHLPTLHDASQKDLINTSGKGYVSSNKYTDDYTQSNNEFPKKRPDPISPSSYQYNLDQPNFDQGFTSSNLKEALRNLSSGPSQTYFEESQNRDNFIVQPTLSSAAQPNPVQPKHNDFNSKTEFPDYNINNEKSNMKIFQHYDTLDRQYNPSQNPNTPLGSGYQHIRPSQTFDSISSQTSRAPINIPQQYNIRDETQYTTPSNMVSLNNNVQSSIRPINIPNLHNGEVLKSQYNKVVSQNYPEINSNNRKTEYNVPKIITTDTRNDQYTSSKSEVLQNSRLNNSVLRYQPQEGSNDSQRKQHIPHTDVSNNGNTNYDSQVSQHNIPNYSLQRPQQANKLESTPDSRYYQSNFVSSSSTSRDPQFSTAMPEGYYYNPPNPQRPQFTDINTLNAHPETHFSQKTSPESHKYFTNSKNIASNIPTTSRPQNVAPKTQENRFSESKSTQYTPTDFKYKSSQNIPSKDQTPQFRHEQSHTYPITTPITPSNQIHDPSYQTRQNNIHPQRPHDSATIVQNSRQPVPNYQQHEDQGYQYNRPEVQGIDYNSSKDLNNLSNSPNSNDNHKFDGAQGRESYPTSSSSEYYPDSNTEGDNNIPNFVNKTDNISSANKDESPRPYNSKNNLKPSSAREDFSGPQQPPSYSPEEGYKY